MTALTAEQDKLAQRYIEEGVLAPKYETDAQHIAIATILEVELNCQLPL